MSWPGAALSAEERVFQTARALVTSNAVIYERNADLQRRMAEWERSTGCSLHDRWARVVRVDGRSRYVRQAATHGEASDGPPADPVVATFEEHRDVRPIAAWIAQQLAYLPRGSQVHEHATCALAASAPDSHSEVIRALSATESQRLWGFEWPPEGLPPSRELEAALVEYRNGLSVDGSVMAGIGATIELYDELAERRVDLEVLARVADPLRAARYDDASHVMQASVFAAADGGEGQAAFSLFRSYSSTVSEQVSAVLAAPTLDDFHEALYGLMPAAIAAVNLGNLLLSAPWVPRSAREGIAARQRTTEEHRVRMLDAISEHIDNLVNGGQAWDRRVAHLAEVARSEGTKAAELRARRLINQRCLYPLVCVDLLVQDL